MQIRRRMMQRRLALLVPHSRHALGCILDLALSSVFTLELAALAPHTPPSIAIAASASDAAALGKVEQLEGGKGNVPCLFHAQYNNKAVVVVVFDGVLEAAAAACFVPDFRLRDQHWQLLEESWWAWKEE